MKKSRWKTFLFVFLALLSLSFIIAEVSYPSEVTINVLQIFYETYNGLTTDFNSFNEGNLSNLSNVILEKTSYGKVEFRENLDIVSMAGEDWTVDFDGDLNISNNLVYVDNYELPGINKAANISIYGLSFSEPEIYHNGVVCSTCNLISYSAGILKFNISSFGGVYYAREKEEESYCGDGVCDDDENSDNCPADCGDSGGDTGGGTTGPTEPVTPSTDVYDFKIFPTLIELELGKGTYFQKEITVENNGTKLLNMRVLVSGLSEFIFPAENFFKIEPGEIKKIRLDIYVSDEKAADVYLGKVKFTNPYVSREADTVLRVKEREALFDIRTTVLKKYVTPGGRVRANISIINMGDLRNFDVNLDYKIYDFDKNEYTSKGEQFAINRTYFGTFFLDSPEDIPIGNYVFYATVRYNNINATSYDTFVVEKVSYVAWIILILVILILIYLIIIWYKDKKEKFESESKTVIRKRKLIPFKKSSVLPKEVPELP